MVIRRSLMAERKTRICRVNDCAVIFSPKLNENSAIAAAKIGKSDSLIKLPHLKTLGRKQGRLANPTNSDLKSIGMHCMQFEPDSV